MSVKITVIVVGALLNPGPFVAPASADEWGCEVLLCASSSDPSWRGVAACHPPMNRLISAMKKPGFDWPVCRQASTGAPGYERYSDCPSGFQVGRSQDRNGFATEQNLCVKTVNTCQGVVHGFHNSDRQGDCIRTISLPRPLRSEPYFFDIKNDTSGRTERHWFELHD